MEMTQLEVEMVGQTSVRAECEPSMTELQDVQLALVGGGCGEVVFA